MHELRFMLHAVHQKNLQFAQTNSQILAELNQGKDRLKALQHEFACTKAVLKVKASELELLYHLVLVVKSQHKIKQTRASVPFNIQHPEPPKERGNKRKSACIGANKRKLESCEGPKEDSNIEEDINAICHSSAGDEPLDREEKRNSPRRKSSRLNPASFEVTKGVFETLHEDIVAPLAPSSSNVLIEQSYEEQVTGRRSSVGRPLRRAAEKIVSYKEKPLNVKMRRA